MEKGITEEIQQISAFINEKCEKYSSNGFLSNEQIEEVFGLKCTSKNPKSLNGIFSRLAFSYPMKDLFRLINIPENGTRITFMHEQPDQETIDNFVNNIKEDVKLDLLSRSVDYFCNFYASNEYVAYQDNPIIKSIEDELFFKNSKQLVKKFFEITGDNLLLESFNTKGFKKEFEENDNLKWYFPKISFVWGCYVINLMYFSIVKRLDSGDAHLINKDDFALDPIVNQKSIRNKDVMKCLINEYYKLSKFILYFKTNGKTKSVKNVNKSLSLKLFNEYTSLLDIHLIAESKSRQLSPIVYIYHNISDKERQPMFRARAFSEMIDKSVRSLTPLFRLNNNIMKFNLLDFNESSIWNNFQSCPQLIEALNKFKSNLLKYVQNIIRYGNFTMLEKYKTDNKRLSENIMIYESLKNSEAVESMHNQIYKHLLNENVTDNIYFHAYKSVYEHKNGKINLE